MGSDVFDLVQVTKRYMKTDPLGKDETDADRPLCFHSEHVKFMVTNTSWDELPQSNAEQAPECTRKVHLENPGAAPDLSGSISTAQDMDAVNTVIITKGLFKGCSTTLSLLLDKAPTAVQESFGRYLEIDPSLQENKVEKKMKVTATVEQQVIPAKGATAAIGAKERRYAGTFKATVYPRGKVMLQGESVYNRDIQQMIQKMKESGGQTAELVKMFERNEVEQKYFWMVEGYCDLRWVYETTVT